MKTIKKIAIFTFITLCAFLLSSTHNLNTNAVVYNSEVQQFEFKVKFVAHADFFTVIVTEDDRVLQLNRLATIESYQDLTIHFALDNDDFIVNVKHARMQDIDAFVVLTFKGDIYTWTPNGSSVSFKGGAIGRENDTLDLKIPKRIYQNNQNTGLRTFDADFTITNIIAVQNNRSLGYSGSGFLSTFTRQTLDFSSVIIENLRNDDFIEGVYGGLNNAIFLSRNQRLYFWGSNSSNRFFPGSTTINSLFDFTDLIRPFFDENINDGIKDIQITIDNIFIQTISNKLIAWGLNNQGQLGTGNTTAISQPIDITNNFIPSGETLKSFSVPRTNFRISTTFTAVLSEEGSLTLSGSNISGLFDSSLTGNVLTPINITSRYQNVLSTNEMIDIIDTNPYSLLVVTNESDVLVVGNVIDSSNRTVTLSVPFSIQEKLSIIRDKKVPLNIEKMFVISSGIVATDSNGDIYGAGFAVNHRMLGLGSNNKRTSFLSSNFRFDQVMKNYHMVAFDQGDFFGIAAFDNGNVYTWGANYTSNGGVVLMRDSNSIFEFNDITASLKLNENEKVIEVSAQSSSNITVRTDLGRVLSWGKKDVLTGVTGNVNLTGSDTGPVDMLTLDHVSNKLNPNETIAMLLEPMLAITSEGRIFDISFNNVFKLDVSHQLPNNEKVLYRSEKYYLSDANKVYEYVIGTGFTDITSALLTNINAAPYSDNSTGIISLDVDNYFFNGAKAIWSIITTNRRIYRLDLNLNVIEEHVLSYPFSNDVPKDFKHHLTSGKIAYYILTEQGFLYSFGNNNDGQLAIGTEVDTTAFKLVNPLETRHFEIKHLSIPAATKASQNTIDVTFLMNHDVSNIIDEIQMNGTYYPIEDFTISNKFHYSIQITHNSLVTETFEVSIDRVKLIDGTIIGTSGQKKQYTRITDEVFALIFDINYETESTSGRRNTQLLEKGASITSSIGTLNRNTYTFDGWFLDQETTQGQLPTAMPNDDLILYAKWTPLSYTLEFRFLYRNSSNNNVEGLIFSEEIPHGTDLSNYIFPTPPEIEGYSFWRFRSLTQTMPTGKVTVYADYTVASYDITFVTNLPEGALGETSKTERLTFGFGINTNRYGISSAPGYTFLGWYETEDFSTPRVNSVPPRDTTLYAKWVLTQYRFYYTNTTNTLNLYNQNDPTFKFNDDISSVIPPDLSPPEGYRVGWFIDYARTNELTFNTLPALPVKNNEVELFQVYAKFILLDFTYTFATDGGLALESITQSFGTNLSLPESVKVGYVFEGWYSDEALTTEYTSTTVEASNITLFAKYTIGNYELNFIDFDNSVIEAFNFDFNTDLATVNLPSAPTRAGFTFTGWSLAIPETMPGENINIQALYKANIHQLTLINNDGNENVVSDQSYLDTLLLPTPSRIGYTFSGWFSDEALENVNTIVTMPDNDVTLYAKWTINQYTISFNSNFGSAVTSIIQDYNTAVTAPIEPTRTGYTFNGWFSDQTLETAYTFTNITAGNIVLYAKWTVNSYTLTFDTAGGDKVEPITEDYNTALTPIPSPTRLGYTFSGWDKVYPTMMPAENITLTATWTINSYTITFNSNEGTSVSPITQDYNTNVSAPSNPTRVGYTFGGWFTAETLLIPYTFTKIEAEDMTLFAKWTVNDYTITFDSAGGSLVSAITLPYNSGIIKPVDPQRAGYVFNSWNEAVPTVMPAENKTLIAFWTPITYTITFNANDGVFSQNQVSAYTVESSNVILFEVTRSGYVFKGWYLESTFDTKITEINTKTELRNVNLYALFFTESFQEFLDDVFALPNPLTKEDKEKVVDLLETLKTFSTFEQGYADEETLLEALTEVKTLEVNYVKTLISSIPAVVTYDDLEKIEAAKEAFDTLDSNQQGDVTNQDDLNTLLGLVSILNQIEALKNAEDIDQEAYETLLLDFDELTEEQKSRISDIVLNDYQAIQDSMSGIGLLGFIGISFSLLFLIIITLWYVNKKRKELKKI
jgi:uncharacterized repeat protein (TIGR02543 family)